MNNLVNRIKSDMITSCKNIKTGFGNRLIGLSLTININFLLSDIHTLSRLIGALEMTASVLAGEEILDIQAQILAEEAIVQPLKGSLAPQFGTGFDPKTIGFTAGTR